jgi:ABC-2 type transport system ATP-binding protein
MSVSVSQVSRLFGQQKALNNVSFNINSGEVVGFLGPNGAGKSTMMKIITGYLPASSGNVSVCGLDVNENNSEFRRLIGYLPEHNPLYHDMYVAEYLEFVAGIYRIQKPAARIREMIGQTGLSPEKNKKIGALSKGYRQRVGLAQALLPNPKVLILDEPTTGLDPNQITEVRELIQNLGREKTVMLSTHIMQEVQAICQRVIIVNQGVIVADEQASLLTSSTFKNESVVKVEFDKPANIAELKKIKGVTDVLVNTSLQYQIISTADYDIRADLFQFAVQNQLVLLGMQKEVKSLEEVFRTLTH